MPKEETSSQLEMPDTLKLELKMEVQGGKFLFWRWWVLVGKCGVGDQQSP